MLPGKRRHTLNGDSEDFPDQIIYNIENNFRKPGRGAEAPGGWQGQRGGPPSGPKGHRREGPQPAKRQVAAGGSWPAGTGPLGKEPRKESPLEFPFISPSKLLPLPHAGLKAAPRRQAHQGHPAELPAGGESGEGRNGQHQATGKGASPDSPRDQMDISMAL